VSAEVVTGDFPTCWEMEVMDNSNAEGGEDENGDVYAWYVNGSSSTVLREFAQSLFHCYGRIRLPCSEMVLGFKGGYSGAPVRSTHAPTPCIPINEWGEGNRSFS
jgi:hypothetical protein